MEFWTVSAGLVLVVAAVLLLALWRGRGAGVAAPATHDIAVYRDQLAEIDRDAGRGVIDTDEAQRLRNEVKRRILEADRAASRQGTGGAGGAAGPWPRLAGAALVIAPLAAAFVVYLGIGAPGYPDLPLARRIDMAREERANRASQAEAEDRAAAALSDAARRAQAAADPQFLQLIDQLRQTVAGRPDDLRGQMLLAQNEARLGNFRAALAAQERVIAIRGDQATVRDLAGRAELLVQAAGGYVSPEAEAALRAVLARDPANGTARFYMGLLEWQTGRPDRAFGIWRDLLEQSPPDVPWVAPIRAGIEDLARLAGIRYTPPPAGAAPLRGPGAADIEAAGAMSAGDRMEMIRGMVAGLADRLDRQGGTPGEWAQLIRAYGVLQQGALARGAWARAQAAHGGDPAAMDTIRAAAQDAGVAQ